MTVLRAFFLLAFGCVNCQSTLPAKTVEGDVGVLLRKIEGRLDALEKLGSKTQKIVEDLEERSDLCSHDNGGLSAGRATVTVGLPDHEETLTSTVCPEGFTPTPNVRGGSCIQIVHEGRSWQHAHGSCLNSGGYLVVIESKAKNDAIIRMLTEDPDAQKLECIWIGAHSVNQEEYIWERTQSPLTFTRFFGDAPTEKNRCLALSFSNGYWWFRDYCVRQCGSLCEILINA